MPTDLSGDSAVMRLFRFRNAQRRGETLSPEVEAESSALRRWGTQNLGLSDMSPGPARPEPGAPLDMGGPRNGLAPSAAQGMSPAPMPGASLPKAPTAPAAPSRQTGIPTLDSLAEMPRKRSRGLRHDRLLGRVTRGGM